MKVNFIITGDTNDVKLMEALNGLLERGYPYKVAAVGGAKAAHAPTPAPAAPTPVTEQLKVYPTPRKVYISAKGKHRRFDHPSGKTSLQLAREYVSQVGTTTFMDLRKYLVGLGFSPSTADNAISRMTVLDLVEVEGIYIGTKHAAPGHR